MINISLTKISIMKKLLLFSTLLFVSLSLFAEGYQINLQSTRQTGMGHTGAGQKLGAASIHFNPGALGMMDSQFDFSAGASAVLSSNSFEGSSGIKEETDNPIGTPFYFYGAGRITDNLYAGLSVTSPFGNSLKWGDDWSGRYLVQDISLQAIFVQPALSFRITDRLSVGAGFSVVFGAVELNRGVDFSDLDPLYQHASGNTSAKAPDGQVFLKGSTTAFGYSAGIFYQLLDNFSLGLGYRSKVEVELDDGDATFSHHELIPQFLSTAMAMQGVNLPDDYEFFPSKFSSMLPMPSSLTFGLAWDISDKWLVAADLQYVGWSAYKSLDFDFDKETAVVKNSSMPKEFDDSMIYRLGVEYNLNSAFSFRGGVSYDQTPISDQYLSPETPGSNKTGLSLGFSWFSNSGLSLDASLLRIIGQERTATFPALPGTYNTTAWVPGIGLNYCF